MAGTWEERAQNAHASRSSIVRAKRHKLNSMILGPRLNFLRLKISELFLDEKRPSFRTIVREIQQEIIRLVKKIAT